MLDLDVHKDARGRLSVLTTETIDPPVVYSYYSDTHKEKARDIDQWHLHKKQTDRFVILSGDAVFGLSDGKDMIRLVVCAMHTRMLIIPPGVYHCFRPFMYATGLINFPTLPYDPEDEVRVKFVDLDVEHLW